MVTGQKGYALLVLLFVTLLLFLLGSTLLSIALSDLRVSTHLAEADRAFYYAEAGIKFLKASLPRQHKKLPSFQVQVEWQESPRFTGQAIPLVGEKYAFLLTAEGQAGKKQRRAAANARYFPFGGNGVIAGSLKATRAMVQGSVYTDRFLLGAGETVISGDLAAREISFGVEGGKYRCLGRDWRRAGEDLVWPEFTSMLAKAKAEFDSPESVEAGESYRLKGPVAGLWYVPGNLLLDSRFSGDGLVVVEGNVKVSGLPAGRVVLFAQGKIVVSGAGGGNVGGRQSLALFSRERIEVSGVGLVFRGVLLAPKVELRDVLLRSCHRAVLPWLDLLPEELLAVNPAFGLEWLETRIRR